jgi:WD40 repeat protein
MVVLLPLARRLARAVLASSVVITCAARATAGDPVQAPVQAPPVETAHYADTLRLVSLAIGGAHFARAVLLLDTCDPKLRGFEWSHLRLCVDVGRAAGPGPSARVNVKPAPATVRISAVTVLRGHDGDPTSACFSPVGSLGDQIASCGRDRTLRLWNAATGACRRVITGIGGIVSCCAIDPECRRVVAGSEDGQTRIFELSSGDPLLVLRAGGGSLRAVSWSADDTHIATGSADGSVRLWSSTASEPRFAIRAHTKPVNAVAFSPDGRVIASGADDGLVRTWDAKTGDPLSTLSDNEGAVLALAFDPTGAMLATAGADKTARLRDARSGATLHVLAGCEGPIENVAFNVDGTRLATASSDGSVRLWDTKSGVQLLVLRGHEGRVHAVSFSAHGDRLLSAGEDLTLRIWETDAAVARAAQRSAVPPLPSVEAAAEMRPMDVDAIAARVVQRAGLDPKLYGAAEELAGAVCDRVPDSGPALTTRGGALYRLGRYDEALEMLTNANDKKRGMPANLAFRAMALAELDRADEAKAMLARLSTLLKETRWANDVEASALHEEARTILAGKTPAKK